MSRDPRYDVLFEPVKIGPVTARNRFYQVPHCNGMGHRRPVSLAAMRGMKAEGGWAVVSTEEIEIHHSAEVDPFAEGRLWDDRDVPGLARMTEAVHAHGSLAAIELVHNAHAAPNRYSRDVPISVSHQPVQTYDPVQARAMDLSDIRALRRWHRDAALRALKAGFDIVYCYAGHDLAIPMHFLCRRYNDRSDEYGGSLENRARLLRELIEDTKEAVGDRCAVAVRLAVDELMGDDGLTSEGEGREVVEMLAELPDLWDVNVSDWSNDSATARFAEEGAQEPYIAFVKQVTSKPVVGVGRFTSPDAMVSQIKRGILDFIGAARPSIADPFLPKKIEEGRLDDIRECIGCNICVSGDTTGVPIRCTQNPTMSEEWRRGWHPELLPPPDSQDSVLVVGAGPAGLECARALGARGYTVTLAEATEELGGRVAAECRLPGLSSWGRVRDYRVGQLNKLAHVEIYRASSLTADQVLEFGFDRVVLATGSRWRRVGVGRQHHKAIPGASQDHVLTPNDIMAGASPTGPVVIYDDDHFYMGGVLAEKLRGDGHSVCLVTPAPLVSQWTTYTLEQERIQKRLLELGVEIVVQHKLAEIGSNAVKLACIYTDRIDEREAGSVVMVTSRLPKDALYRELASDPDRLAQAGIKSLARIGDCLAPGTIAAAVWSGHRAARELELPESDAVPFKREITGLEPA
ncbi:MAG: FAD-dependent oxidoreductase [Phycisphaerales bacterium JB039]